MRVVNLDFCEVKAADFTQRHDTLNNNNEVFNNLQCFPTYYSFLNFSCLAFIQETFSYRE
jgi:hypothetical protein